MNSQTTPQWRNLIRGLLIACLVLIAINAQTWLLLTHRASSTTISGVTGAIGMAIGALVLLFALARAWRWPLPQKLRGPASASRYAWRLAVVGALLIAMGAFEAFGRLSNR
jgi:uncharacterized membrane protein HdeD (DUF308 family)